MSVAQGLCLHWAVTAPSCRRSIRLSGRLTAAWPRAHAAEGECERGDVVGGCKRSGSETKKRRILAKDAAFFHARCSRCPHSMQATCVNHPRHTCAPSIMPTAQHEAGSKSSHMASSSKNPTHRRLVSSLQLHTKRHCTAKLSDECPPIASVSFFFRHADAELTPRGARLVPQREVFPRSETGGRGRYRRRLHSAHDAQPTLEGPHPPATDPLRKPSKHATEEIGC